MKFVSLWKDELFSVPSGGSEPFVYEITHDDEAVFSGKAYRFNSGATINVMKIIRDWVVMNVPEFLEIQDDFMYHHEALGTFRLKGGDGTVYETYIVLFNSSDDWNGEDMMISQPINGHSDPRQKIFFSYVSLSGATVDVDMTDFYFEIGNASVSFAGGSIVIPINTNYKPYQFYFDAPSGMTVVSYDRDKVVVNVEPNATIVERTFYLVAKRASDDAVLGTAVITQAGEAVRFTCDSLVELPVFGGNATIHFSTNIPIELISYVLPAGVSGVSFTNGELIVNVAPSGGVGMDDYVRFYFDGNVVGRTRVVQDTMYFTCDSEVFIPKTGGTVTLHYQTNIPESAITYNLPEGFTGVTFSNGNFTVSVPPNDGGKYVGYTTFYYGGFYLDYIKYTISGNIYESEYFTIEAEDNGTLLQSRSGAYGKIQYRKNGGSWTTRNSATICDVSVGDVVELKATRTTVQTNFDNMAQGFSINKNDNAYNGRFKAYGNVLSMLYGDDFTSASSVSANAFKKMFFLTYITDASGLYMPDFELSDNCCELMFHQCRQLKKAPSLPSTKMGENCYLNMFSGCDALESVPEINATVLAKNCYGGMFSGCHAMISAPILPATALTESCYYGMFASCIGLTVAPELPATVLAKSCYEQMFSNCYNLAVAPELPATTLAERCYRSMFEMSLDSYLDEPMYLRTAPNLPATNLAPMCYQKMFFRCKELVSVQRTLPATILAANCYEDMFGHCDALRTAPLLPATTLANGCYYLMFEYCSSLVYPPVLSAMNLVESCYSGMFQYCTSLVNAPALPAITLTVSCYSGMFQGCTSLINAPELNSTNPLPQYAYSWMFYGCTNLNYIKALFKSQTNSNSTNNWVGGVSPTGTFVKSSENTTITEGDSGIPTGWTVEVA